jgi:phosphatidylglycerophosphatase A
MGCGNSPLAPGTVGSLGSLPLHWLLHSTSVGVHLACVAGITGLGFWASQIVADDLGQKDPGRVVIDEVAGVLIAMGLVRHEPWQIQLFAFVAFRALDILKPPPIRQAERVSPAGVGIMLDDLVAGLGAGGLALLLGWSGTLDRL